MRPTLFLSCAVVLALALSIAVTAGPLTPPTGPITSTGRFGPRIDINTLAGDANSLHRITQSGSYYLSANITGASGTSAIEIATSNVTIDLNGFELIGVAGSLDGITSSGFTDRVRIRNGVIRNWGGRGVFVNGGHASVEGLTLRFNGSYAIQVMAFGAIVKDCVVSQNGQSVAGTGGIDVDSDALIMNCTLNGNAGTGLQTGFGCVIADNVIAVHTQGVNAGAESCLTGNAARANGANTTVNCTVANNRGL